MMYPEFAYSSAMQFILGIISTASAHIFVYLIAELILMSYGEKASRKQKHIFAFWLGIVMNQVWAYAIYFICGMAPFPSLMYSLVVTPNPVFALLYYLVGIKVLKLSPIRSIKLMGHVFLYYVTIKSISSLVRSIFFVQPGGRYNYLIDAYHQIFNLIFTVTISCVLINILKRNKNIIKITESLFITVKQELAIYLAKSLIIYLFVVFFPIYLSEKPIGARFIIFAAIIMLFIIAYMFDIYSSTKLDLINREVYINTISKNTEELRDILQAYGGYIEIGDLEKLKKYHASLSHLKIYPGSTDELSQRLNENPALISLLMNKHDYSKNMGVDLWISLQTNVEDLYINNMEICSVIAYLLDNAIEAAAVSKQKKISLIIGPNRIGSKLIVITNSTAEPVDTNKIISPGITSEQGHLGIGLPIVRKIIAKYSNCTFQLSYYNYQLAVYIQTRQNF